MEPDPKGKAPVPAEGWDLAAVEKERAAVKDAAGDKAAVAARGKAKAKGAVKPKRRTANRISELL